jgi:hypothetical protein
MYESVIDLVGGEATMLFVELHYTLATEEAERIGVDHVARMSSNEAGESSLGELFVNIISYRGTDCYNMLWCSGYHSYSYSG